MHRVNPPTFAAIGNAASAPTPLNYAPTPARTPRCAGTTRGGKRAVPCGPGPADAKHGRHIDAVQGARRVASQMPNAIGTMPSRSSHDTGSRSTSQPNNKPNGGIRKCSALAAVALARPRIMNHR